MKTKHERITYCTDSLIYVLQNKGVNGDLESIARPIVYNLYLLGLYDNRNFEYDNSSESRFRQKESERRDKVSERKRNELDNMLKPYNLKVTYYGIRPAIKEVNSLKSYSGVTSGLWG